MLPLRVDTIETGGRTEHGRVAVPENVLCHMKSDKFLFRLNPKCFLFISICRYSSNMDVLGLSVLFSILQLQFVVVESHLDKEPQITCVSEFDYDYRTLQKVLETEHSHKELEKTVATQQQMIKDLNEKINSPGKGVTETC